MANINNIKTGNVNIPGALHSTGGDGNGLVGGVVAYAGDIYDTTLGKNQSQINQEFSDSLSSAPTYSAGTGISISNNTISVNTGELSYTDLLNKPRLATVATTGYFEDLRINPFIYDISAYNLLQRVGSFAQGTDSVYASGNAHAEGDNTTAYLSSHAEGKDTLADGSHSHAEGRGIIFDTLTLSPSDRYYYNNATSKLYIFLDQSTKSAYNNVPIGAEVTLSFDEGGAFPESYVSNKYCYLEQDDSKTPVLEISGIRSNSTISAFYDNSSYVLGEGYKFSLSATIKFRTSSRGNWSHTEGYGTNASGDYSHAGGYCTVTTNEYEVAFGKYNVSELGTIFSVGCGDWDDSDISNNNYGLDNYGLNEYNLNKNALTITLYGNVYLKDVGGYDGRELTGKTDLATIITNVNTRLAALEGVTITAEDVTYDSSETYTSGTVGNAIQTGITSAAASAAAAASSASTASGYYSDILTAMGSLGSGEAVAAQVAINQADIAGLKSNIVVDLSTRYSTSYANLSAALTALNSDTATDAAAIKKAGVSVKFINSSTNKYEQWNLKASSWSTNTSDWVSVTNPKAEDVSYGSNNVKKELDKFQALNPRIVDSITTMDTTQCMNASTASKYINADGVITTVDGAAWRVTDEIDIEGAYRIVCSVAEAKYNSSALIVAFYDASHTFISGSQSYEYDGGIPTNAKYVRVAFRKYTNDTVSLSSYTYTYDAGLTSENVSYNNSNVKVALDDIKTDIASLTPYISIHSISKDKSQLSGIATNCLYIASTGEVTTLSSDQTAWYVTDEIELPTSPTRIVIACSYIYPSSALTLAFYDASHTFISGAATVEVDMAIPTNAKYVRMAFRSFQPADIATMVIYYNTIYIPTSASDVTYNDTNVKAILDTNLPKVDEAFDVIDERMVTKYTNKDKAQLVLISTSERVLNTTGELVTKSGETAWYVSDEIDIEGKNSISWEVTAIRVSATNLVIAFYDSSHVFISGSNNLSGTVSIPSNAKYLRIAFRKFSGSDVANISISYKEFDIANDVTPIATQIAESVSSEIVSTEIAAMEAEMFTLKSFTYAASNSDTALGLNGKARSSTNAILSDFIKINDTKIESISLSFLKGTFLGIAFYSAANEDAFISGYDDIEGLTALISNWYKGTLTNVDVPTGTMYIRYMGNYTLAPSSNSCTCKKYANDSSGKAEAPSGIYTNPIDTKTTNYELISYNVDCTVPDVEDSVHSTSVIPKVVSEDQALIHLPNTYTSSKTPTRLVIWNHGAGGRVEDRNGSIIAEGWKSKFTNLLLANGYAVLYVNGVPEYFRNTKYLDGENNHNGYATHMGSWMFMRSVYAAYKYVIDKYNICTDGVFVAGQSMGGLASINLVNAGVLPVKGMLIDAPVINAYRDAYFSGGWSGGTLGGRTAAIFAWVYQWGHCDWETDKYTIDGETWKDLANLKDNASDMAALWEYNKQKMFGYNGYTAGQMLIANLDNSYVDTIESSNDNEENYWGIKFPCPVRIYFDSLDATNQCSIAEKWIKKLRNAGTLASMRSVEIATNDHCILNKEVSGEYPFAIDAINWLNQHNG